jgi:hypothetical protein
VRAVRDYGARVSLSTINSPSKLVSRPCFFSPLSLGAIAYVVLELGFCAAFGRGLRLLLRGVSLALSRSTTNVHVNS